MMVPYSVRAAHQKLATSPTWVDGLLPVGLLFAERSYLPEGFLWPVVWARLLCR